MPRQSDETEIEPLNILFLLRMLVRPISTSREIARQTSIAPAFWVVLGFSLYLAYGFATSQSAYPPPQHELDGWIKAWGEFAMLPVLPIAPEYYRTFLAIIVLPLMLVAWLLMAVSAKGFTNLVGGKAPLRVWLNQAVFAFFPFWIMAVLMDGLFSGIFGSYLVPALEGQYGSFWQDFVIYFPQFMYTILYGIGWAYASIAAYQTERFAVWKAVVTGWVIFIWPMVISALLFR
ncbi:MAG: hypothetical protein JW704_03765 [Anaerolineaceae bacterium]|nr:hypothetical protein [Anaerolineaceae bacterium]